MRKILTILMLLALAVPMWAGEKTITISRNDVDWESANTVYNITKGGVQLVMSGGMNNPNFLLMKQHTTITVKSHNFNIKKIVFHCLDNYTNDNLDPFYWGPKTLHIQYSQTHSEYAGKLTYDYGGSSYDACWNSTFTGTTSTNGTNHVKYADGIPAGYELMFENEGTPVRFASIDIVIEQEVGDMFELVTAQNEVTTGTTYMLVNRESYATTQGYALSVNTTGETSNDDLLSTPVELIDDGMRVKANSETQFITFETSGDTSYPYCVKAGSNYIRTQSTLVTTTGRRGYHLTKVANKPSSDYVNTKVTINTNGIQTNWGYYAAIKYQGSSFADYAFRHIAKYTDGNTTYSYYQFRNMYDQAYSDRRVYLYKPSKQYKVTTEVQPDAAYGSISLRDGILVDNGINWSQKMDTVQFLVTAADGYKISNITIQAKNDNGTVVEAVSPLNETTSINGTLYTFVMPGYNTHIIATFEEVTYHDINIVVKPSSLCGNVFITEGYVVQNDQVKSYDGQNVVFNVTPNPINPADESEGYYELSYVTVTDNVTGVETTLVPDANGNYTFTMPDNEVTITAYFYDTTKSPLWLIGTANGGEWHPYGPRFNYNNDTDEYYIDVYFKGTGNYGDQTGDNWGEFRVTWLVNAVGDEDWSKIQNKGKQGHPWATSPDPSTNNQHVYENGGVYRLSDGQEYGLDYSGGRYYYGYNNEQSSYQEDYKFTVDPGIYRIYVGTTESQNKGGLGLNVLKVVKYPTTLAFDPAGGADAASAVEVPQHQVVSLVGDLYSKIKAINPDEVDDNFMYKATPSVGDAAQATQSESAGASTTTIATLDVVNEGETVTKLDGVNYLGWIVAENTAYYKVIETPLHWIERDGVKDKTYTVSDQLQGVYAQGTSLWCKDLGDISNVKTTPNEGQIDFLGTTLKTTDHLFADNMRTSDWDQSNWVELDFSDFGTNGITMASDLVNHYIKAKTVTGVYTDDVNYTIKLTANPTADGDASYVPNTYCTANFVESNLKIGENVGPVDNGKTYYFLNPKVQEYAIVTFAMWDKANQIMVIPNNTPFNGAATIGRWDLNEYGDQLSSLDAASEAPETQNNAYEFHIIVQRANKSYGEPVAQVQGAPGLKATDDVVTAKEDQTSTGIILAQPLDLKADSPLPTGINGVVSDAKVVGVEYVNIAGMRSSKPFKGVNIVVTRYSDGSTTTSKVIK